MSFNELMTVMAHSLSCFSNHANDFFVCLLGFAPNFVTSGSSYYDQLPSLDIVWLLFCHIS